VLFSFVCACVGWLLAVLPRPDETKNVIMIGSGCMWIMSQNRKLLINTDKVSTFIVETSDYCDAVQRVLVTVDGDTYVIAEYSDKEQAMQTLESIYRYLSTDCKLYMIT
jgi:hypothetical protein